MYSHVLTLLLELYLVLMIAIFTGMVFVVIDSYFGLHLEPYLLIDTLHLCVYTVDTLYLYSTK